MAAARTPAHPCDLPLAGASPTASEELGASVDLVQVLGRRRNVAGRGSPRIHAELADRSCHTSRKRVAWLMRVHGLTARRRRRFRVTTQSRHPFPDYASGTKDWTGTEVLTRNVN